MSKFLKKKVIQQPTTKTLIQRNGAFKPVNLTMFKCQITKCKLLSKFVQSIHKKHEFENWILVDNLTD